MSAGTSAGTSAAVPAVAVVTGGGRGIGRAVARRLAGEGWRVVAVARTAGDLAVTAAAHPGIEPVVGDVTVEGDVEAVADRAQRLGRLRAWVNNAGTVDPCPLVDLDLDRWERTVAGNLRSCFLGCRAALRRMAEGGGGAIVNVATLGAVPYVEKLPGLAAYTAAKAGVVGLTEAVAAEGRAVGVRCVAVSPGAVDTDMLRRAAPGLRPGATPEDIAALVTWLVGEEARLLTGVNIPVFSNA